MSKRILVLFTVVAAVTAFAHWNVLRPEAAGSEAPRPAVETYGVVSADRPWVAVGVPAHARVIEVRVQPAASVVQGQVLGVLESATVAERRVRRQVARTELDKVLQMPAGRDRDMRLEDARAELNAAESRLEGIPDEPGARVTVHAPAAGHLVAAAHVGDEVEPDGRLFRIEDPSLKAVVAAFEDTATVPAVNRTVQLESPSQRGLPPFTGHVVNVKTTGSGTVLVRIEVADPEDHLAVGARVTVQLTGHGGAR